MNFTCSGSSCTGTTVPSQGQVQNAASALAVDKNGVLVSFPSVPVGRRFFGERLPHPRDRTQSNNSLSGVTAFPANPSNGNFSTNYNDVKYNAFLGTGSNGLFFPLSQIPTTADGQWFNPSSVLTLSAMNTGYPGGTVRTGSVPGSYLQCLIATSNNMFCDLAGPGTDGYFDWGFPFFLGSNIYIGIEGTTSALGTGLYWTY